jgi:hypothetical protein
VDFNYFSLEFFMTFFRWFCVCMCGVWVTEKRKSVGGRRKRILLEGTLELSWKNKDTLRD